ncbi:ArdC family protein [Xylanimonas cellulosilytica]|uniref:ArdC family protein n=1 Tax=Xylanimonas cellulosilytica TaxID=186189 RepID=UPI00019C0B38|nr:ArdC family protein [Xylanimonas cellulosilytica]
MHVTHSSSTEREAKLDAVHDQLLDAVGALTTDADWRRALEFASRFTSRSFSNTMLIYVQHAAAYEAGTVPEPVPTYVAGYRQWQALGRQVRRGQHGYVIVAPVTQRLVATNPETGPWRRLESGERAAPGETQRSRLVGVRPATVFDPLSAVWTTSAHDA